MNGMYVYQPEDSTEVSEAVELWRRGIPTNVDLAEVGIWFDEYDRYIAVLVRLGNPRYDVIETGLRGYKNYLRERVDQQLRASGDLQ